MHSASCVMPKHGGEGLTITITIAVAKPHRSVDSNKRLGRVDVQHPSCLRSLPWIALLLCTRLL